MIVRALEGGNRLTRDELAAVLDRARIDRVGQRMPYILIHCELEALIASGGLSGKHQTYALLDERFPKGGKFGGEDPLVELTLRYLMSHGPATVKDVSWWSGLTMGDIRKALAALGSEVEQETVDGLTFWAVRTDGDPPTARGVHSSRRTTRRSSGTPSHDGSATRSPRPSLPPGVIRAGRAV